MQIAALTFQRPFNLRAMEWAEFALENRVWGIPATKMKTRVARKETAPPHHIPLSKAALAFIAEIPRVVERRIAFQTRDPRSTPCPMPQWAAHCNPWAIPKSK